MVRPARIGAHSILIAVLLTLAPHIDAANDERLPYELVVVNSHSWGEGTDAWIADMDGDGLDELVGGNQELGHVCPIRFVGGTYLEAGQINLPKDVESLHEIVYLRPQNIDDDPADEFLMSVVERDTLWLFVYELGQGLEARIPITRGENRGRRPWWEGRVHNVCRVGLGDGRHGCAVAMGADLDLLPRGVLLFDGGFESVLWAFEGGAQFRWVDGGDVDGDGRGEVAFGTSAVANGARANGTSDAESYVGVLDDDGELLWLESMGGPSTDTHLILADLSGDGSPEVVSATTPEQDDEEPASALAVWSGATGEPLGSVGVPGRVSVLTAGEARSGEHHVFFGNGGRALFELGLLNGEAAVLRTAELRGAGHPRTCVPFDGVSGDCLLVGFEDGRLAVYDTEFRLLAQHWPYREPIFTEPPFLGLYQETETAVRLCGISDRAYFFDLVPAPVDWALLWLVAAVASASAAVTAVSVSQGLRARLRRALIEAVAPLLPWAAAQRAEARLELLKELETGSHDKMIVTRPLRHLVEMLTMARGAGKSPEQLRSIGERWITKYRETSELELSHILDLASAWGGDVDAERALGAAVESIEGGLRKLEGALDGDPAPELASLAMRVDALETALQSLRASAGEAYVTEVASAVRDVLELESGELERAAVELSIELKEVEHARAWVAPADLQFVVANLVSNAVRAMVGGEERRLDIVGTSRGGFVELRFADTGCGLAEEEWERVFELGETTKAGAGGTGLYRSREAIRGLGGKLNVESGASGQGATMVLRLRMARPPGLRTAGPGPSV